MMRFPSTPLPTAGRPGRSFRVWADMVRWKNLLIVAATQYLMRAVLLEPLLESIPSVPVLDGMHFFLLVLDTVLITAGGYLVNDLYDARADALNRPDTVRIGTAVTSRSASRAYRLVTGVGGMLAAYLAWVVDRPAWFTFYPMAVALLWLYSYRLKRLPLAGNLLIAVYCSLAAAVVFLPDHVQWLSHQTEPESPAGRFRVILAVYLWFSFHITLVRELIKDAEDMEGDRAVAARTYPVLYGYRRTNALLSALNAILLAGVCVFAAWHWQVGNRWSAVGWVMGMAIPLFGLGYRIMLAAEKQHYSRLSTYTKGLMLVGLLLLFLWKY